MSTVRTDNLSTLDELYSVGVKEMVQYGTFASGLTVTHRFNQVKDTKGNVWEWTGPLPKTVTAGTVPSTAAGGWQMIQAVAVDGIKALSATPNLPQTVNGFYVGSNVGGGIFVYDATKSKTLHNGGTIIAPEAITAWNGSASDIGTLLNWTGTGSGCFLRITPVTGISCFGGNNTVAADCVTKMYAAGYTKIVIDVDVNIEKNITLTGYIELLASTDKVPTISFSSTTNQQGLAFVNDGLRIEGIKFKSGGIVDQVIYLKDKKNVSLVDCAFDFSATTASLTGGAHGGIFAENLSDALFESNTFTGAWRDTSFNAGSPTGFGGNNLARVINIANTNVNSNVRFVRNTFKKVWSCVYINNTNAILFDSNYVEETADSGFFDRCTAGYSKGKKFVNNVFVNIGKTPIKTLDTNNITVGAYASDALVSGNTFNGWGKFLNAECVLIARGYDTAYIWQSQKNFNAVVENNLFEQQSGYITKRPFLFINVENLVVSNNKVKIVDDDKLNEIYVFQWCKDCKLLSNTFDTNSRIYLSYKHQGEMRVANNSFKVGKELEITGQEASLDQYHMVEGNTIVNSETAWRHFGLVISSVTSNCMLKYTDNFHVTDNAYEDGRENTNINMVGLAYAMTHLIDNNVVKYSDKFATQKSIGGDILYAVYYQGTKGGCKVNSTNGQLTYKATDGRTTGQYLINGTAF